MHGEAVHLRFAVWDRWVVANPILALTLTLTLTLTLALTLILT